MNGVKEMALQEKATPDPITKRGITEAQWKTLTSSLYPGANPNSILLVWDYCLARRLDPLKKPCHIVPMEVKDTKTNKYEWRDVVMPGIYEHRTTAQRTGEYLGHSKPEYGPVVDVKGIKAPEWCALTIYRHNAVAGKAVEFPVQVWFREVVALNKEGKVNGRWTRAPIQMLEKCTEAKGLREAFPDELGGEQTAEEMDGQRAIEITPMPAAVSVPKPDAFDDWLLDLTAVSDEGSALFAEAWARAPEVCRNYLTRTEPETWDGLKARAVRADAAKATGE